MARVFKTREQWLQEGIRRLSPRIKAFGTLPEKLNAIVSWPNGSKKAIGQCFGSVWAKDGSTYVTISPVLGDDPGRVLDVLLHELIHALQSGMKLPLDHGKFFKKVAHGVGLTGPMRATSATPELALELKAMAEAMGPYPHATMVNGHAAAEKKPGAETGPLTLVSPVNPEFTIYMSRKKFSELGAPLCPESKRAMVVRA
jgi:hypothetical protein